MWQKTVVQAKGGRGERRREKEREERERGLLAHASHKSASARAADTRGEAVGKRGGQAVRKKRRGGGRDANKRRRDSPSAAVRIEERKKKEEKRERAEGRSVKRGKKRERNECGVP